MIGVSKRCCPVCAHLLRILKTWDKKLFIVTGEHSQFTACALPPGLPDTIVEQMVLEFAGRLRKELVRLLKTNKVTHSRVRSTDSRRLSLPDRFANVPNCTYDDPSYVASAYNMVP